MPTALSMAGSLIHSMPAALSKAGSLIHSMPTATSMAGSLIHSYIVKMSACMCGPFRGQECVDQLEGCWKQPQQ
eukprot:3996930-Karenia_brevis.AAC.1